MIQLVGMGSSPGIEGTWPVRSPGTHPMLEGHNVITHEGEVSCEGEGIT